jgi:tagatose-1,6-bisphosphate aldolase
MPTRLISLGKSHGLQRCATSQGTFTILAADHRDALRVLISPAQPQTHLTAYRQGRIFKRWPYPFVKP